MKFTSVLLCLGIILSSCHNNVSAFLPTKVQQQSQPSQQNNNNIGVSGTLTFARDQSLLRLWAQGDKDREGNDERGNNILTKSSWYAVEWFGKAFGNANNKQNGNNNDDDDSNGSHSLESSPKSISETLGRIKQDNDRSYFLSGEVDALIYDPECVFSDPFVSFAGRDRFITNLANLGSFITKYSAKVINYSTINENDAIVETKIMVKLELNLPWKPILAWPWGVKYTIDPDTYLIVDHEESWDIAPLDGVKQIFRKPTVQI